MRCSQLTPASPPHLWSVFPITVDDLPTENVSGLVGDRLFMQTYSFQKLHTRRSLSQSVTPYRLTVDADCVITPAALGPPASDCQTASDQGKKVSSTYAQLKSLRVLSASYSMTACRAINLNSCQLTAVRYSCQLAVSQSQRNSHGCIRSVTSWQWRH